MFLCSGRPADRLLARPGKRTGHHGVRGLQRRRPDGFPGRFLRLDRALQSDVRVRESGGLVSHRRSGGSDQVGDPRGVARAGRVPGCLRVGQGLAGPCRATAHELLARGRGGDRGSRGAGRPDHRLRVPRLPPSACGYLLWSGRRGGAFPDRDDTGRPRGGRQGSDSDRCRVGSDLDARGLRRFLLAGRHNRRRIRLCRIHRPGCGRHAGPQPNGLCSRFLRRVTDQEHRQTAPSDAV